MKFDDFLLLINDWGKYQKIKYLIICLTYMLPPIMVYTYTFTAAVPNYYCYQSNNSMSEQECSQLKKTISLKECQRCFIKINETIQSCRNFVFDKTYYESTLVEEWSTVCDDIVYRSWVQMIFFVGYMFGSVLFGILSDRYGRRPIMSISFVLMTFSSFLCSFGPQKSFGFWPSYLIFILGRFLVACSTRGISVSGFVLGSEIVGPKKRLLTGIVIEYFFAFGQMILLLFAYFIRQWRLLSYSISLFTIPYLFFYFVLPESPRWLMSKGKLDEAEQILRKIAKTNGVEFDEKAFDQLKREHNEKKNDSIGIRSLFSSRSMSFITINLFFQWLIQNLVFYGISQNTGSWNLSPYESFGLSAFVELLGYIVVHLILDRIGRKIPYCSFVILFSLISFLIISIDQNNKILINLINMTLKFLASSSYAIIYIYANELFPTNVRNTGMGICSMIARIGAIIGTFSNDNLTRISINLPVILYGSMSLIAGLIALLLPETLNVSLPENVQEIENLNNLFEKKRKNEEKEIEFVERF